MPDAPTGMRRLPAVRMFVQEHLRECWFSIDHRSLGLFRIVFGLCLIGNLYDHAAGGNLVAFYSNDGVLTNHLSLFAPIQERPWSLLFAFSRPGEVAIAFAAIFVVYLLYTVGWKTRSMQVLVVVCLVSIANRNLLLQDGGSFTCTVLAVWTLFLPLGARFSVDRWLRFPRWRAYLSDEPGEPAALDRRSPLALGTTSHVSFVCFALLVQLAVIYGFNAGHKTGSTWRSGTAVHYILWQMSRNTSLVNFLRLHEPRWFSPVLTHATIIFEWSAPVLVLMPVFQKVCRRVLILGMWALHLGIASMMSLGPFSYAMLSFSVLLLRPADWRTLEPVTRWVSRQVRSARERTPSLFLAVTLGCMDRFRREQHFLQPRSAGRWRVALREGAALLLFVAMFAELTLANVIVPERLRWTSRPEWMAHTLYYLRLYQTWGMFSPDVPTNDGGLVVDAVLADGSHIDPLSGRPPDFEAPLHGSYGLDHDWSEYMFYYPWDRHRIFRGGLRDYILNREQARVVPPEKRIRSFDIYRVSADCPPPGETRPRNLARELMISYVAPP